MNAAVMNQPVNEALLEGERQTHLEQPTRVPAQFHVTRESPKWNLATKIGFRFAFVYFILYNLPSPLDYLPFLEPVLNKYAALWNNLVPWVGRHFLGLNIAVLPNGSGDTTFNYVQVLCFLALAATATVMWTLLDNRRDNYAKLDRWLRLYLRITLGTILLLYGSMKVIQAQMPAPGLSRLVESYGESSPMGLLWTFMGASRGYNAFAGGAEMLSGLLLIIPGLTTLGALLSIAVLSNVFMLNMCYDVPVKLFSFHLLLMALFLAAPDLGRLRDLFLLKRQVELAPTPALFARRWLNRSLTVAQWVFALLVSVMFLYQTHQYTSHGTETVGAPLYGVWSVEEYTVDGQVKPPLASDEGRWQRVIFDNPHRLIVQPMFGSRQRFVLSLDSSKHSFTLGKVDDEKWKADFTFQNPASGRLTLVGNMDGYKVTATLRQLDVQKTFLLTSRGFHWINEYPFNR